MERVLVAIGRRGGRLPRRAADGVCPLLGKDGPGGASCTIYEDRPFGCRTYFCDDATLPDGNRRAEVDRLARDLRAVAERAGDAEVVPLTSRLSAAFDRDGRRRNP